MQSRFAYYLVRSPASRLSENTVLFASWLQRIAGESLGQQEQPA
jgi:hypothetical protein